MNSNRKNSYWILIAILLSLQIYVGEQQVTSCPSGKFLAPVGADNTAAKACVEQKYFVHDADYYTVTTFDAKCLSTDVLITLVDGVQKGCMQVSEITYLCPSYSRTANGADHGVYACTGCPAGPFKYIVKLKTPASIKTVAALDTTMDKIANPLGIDKTGSLTFAKACTVELIPNCFEYDLDTKPTVAPYKFHQISTCTTCTATITSLIAKANFFYSNDALFTDSVKTPANNLLGSACPLKVTQDVKKCTDVFLSDDKLSYKCKDTCTDYFKYQQGTYDEICIAKANIQYYDALCVLYDNYDLSRKVADITDSTSLTFGKPTGNCIKCKDPTLQDLVVVKDTAVTSKIVRNACVLKATLLPLQPCTSYELNAGTLTCTGCPGGYTFDSTNKVCVLNDRYIAVPNCKDSPLTAPASTQSTSIKCTACVVQTPVIKEPYCTTFTNTVASVTTGAYYGVKCTTTENGNLQISGTFVDKNTGLTNSVFACVATADSQIVIDACAGYQVVVDYDTSKTPNVPRTDVTKTKLLATAVGDVKKSSCDVCQSGYTRVLSEQSTVDKYICIKNALVDQNCKKYYILTLNCFECVKDSVIDSTTRRCKAPSDYTANCANATTDKFYAADGTTVKETRYRCIGCLTGFTLLNIGQGDFCVPSVVGCANLTVFGTCAACASANQQVVAQKTCVTLPLNCKNVALNGTCIDCKDGFIFNTVTSACSQAAASGSNAQVACPDGQYFDSNGVCVVGSIANCLKYTISGASIKCSSCKTGYHTSNFGAQCDLDDPALAGVKCQDQPAGDSYIWFKSPQSGACLKKDKHCGNWSFEDLENKMVSCSTCDDPRYYIEKGRCYLYDTSSTNTVANN